MTVQELYKNYQIKVNKNDSNKNISVNKGIFVKTYNEQSKLWLSKQIETKQNSDKQNDIDEFLIIDKEITKYQETENNSYFNLPDDFFELADSYSIASKGKCSNRKLYNWDFKIKNRTAIFQDTNNKPSFEYEETLVKLSNGYLVVFKEDFSIDKQILTYYKQPPEIDIEGYIKEDGSYSQNIDPQLSDFNVNKILSYCVEETIRIFENPDGFQLAQDRTNKDK